MSSIKTIRLTLFDSTKVKVLIDRVEISQDGKIVAYGHFENQKSSMFIMVIRDHIVMANFNFKLKNYGIRHSKDNIHYLFEEKNLDKFLDDDLVPAIKNPSDLNSARISTDFYEDGSVIDIMVLYSGALKDYRGGDLAVKTYIDMKIAETNQCFMNSEIATKLNLVFSGEVSIQDTVALNLSLTLGLLRGKGDGVLDTVHYLRNKYHADLVSLLVNNSAGFSGLAYITRPSLDEAENGFSITTTFQDFIFTHEVGHNLGCNHDRSLTNFPGAYNYSHGYVFKDQTKGTIMSYYTRIPYFSNPNIEIDGEKIGIDSSDVNNSSDNARSINKMSWIVANFITNLTGKGIYKVKIDTTICEGLTYFVGGANQNTSGLYYDTLQAINKYDSIVITNLQIKPCPVVGIPKEDPIALDIFPVPTNRFLNIGFNFRYLELYTLLGEVVTKTEDNLIDLADYSSGIYIIRVHTESGKIVSRKIIYIK